MELTKRQRQKENTKLKIIQTAYEVYCKNGFSTATSVIAKEAGVSHGTLFVHFPTLNDLIVCILERFAETLGISLHNLSKENDHIESILEAHLDMLEIHEEFYIRLLTEMSLLPDEAKNIFVTLQSTISFHLGEVMKKEIEGGRIKDIPVHMMFNLWIGLVHYYLQNKEFFAPNSNVITKHRIELISTFLELTNIH